MPLRTCGTSVLLTFLTAQLVAAQVRQISGRPRRTRRIALWEAVFVTVRGWASLDRYASLWAPGQSAHRSPGQYPPDVVFSTLPIRTAEVLPRQ